MNKGTNAIEARLKQCLTAIQRLKNKGIQVQAVELGTKTPSITIARPSPNQLSGETALIENSFRGRTHCKVARFANCLIRWEVQP